MELNGDQWWILDTSTSRFLLEQIEHIVHVKYLHKKVE